MKAILIIILVYCNINISYAREKITLASDIWCPYTCSSKDLPGYMIEIAQKILIKHDITVEYKIMSWNEAIRKMQTGEVDAIVGASKSGQRTDWVFPDNYQALDITGCYVRSNDSWEYININSFNNKIIGLILNYQYPWELASYIDANYDLKPHNFIFSSGNDAVGDNVELLIERKTDVYVENINVMSMYLSSNKEKNIKQAGVINKNPEFLYIAFSPKLRRAGVYAQMISDGMVYLRNSGELQKLYNKYGIYQNLVK